jgi:hypothetical protein
MGERIVFDRSLYLPEAVEAAAAAYADHAEIAVTRASDAVIAEVSNVVELDLQLVLNAFCNHALHETITRMREAARQEGA